MRLALIDQAKEQFPVQRLCGVPGVSASGYLPGGIDRRAVASATLWCCSH